MRKIINPFASLEGYNCFGCSQTNQSGLQLSFIEEGDEIVSNWLPKSSFQGYWNVLHGGIQATLMDEIASWTVYVKVKRAGVTSRAEIKYLKPIYIDRGGIQIRSTLVQLRKNLADISVKIFDANSQLCAEGIFTYFTFSEKKSKEEMYYPEPEDFFEKESVYRPL